MSRLPWPVQSARPCHCHKNGSLMDSLPEKRPGKFNKVAQFEEGSSFQNESPSQTLSSRVANMQKSDYPYYHIESCNREDLCQSGTIMNICIIYIYMTFTVTLSKRAISFGWLPFLGIKRTPPPPAHPWWKDSTQRWKGCWWLMVLNKFHRRFGNPNPRDDILATNTSNQALWLDH